MRLISLFALQASAVLASAALFGIGHAEIRSPAAMRLPQPQMQSSGDRRVNAPHFDGDVRYSETAIFWFGRVTPIENYADVRVGYNDSHLFAELAIFDRRLWYDLSPTPDDLTNWDAVSLYLDMDGMRPMPMPIALMPNWLGGNPATTSRQPIKATGATGQPHPSPSPRPLVGAASNQRPTTIKLMIEAGV
jgi:hypothetical protein